MGNGRGVVLLVALLAVWGIASKAQQLSDTSFRWTPAHSEFAVQQGPRLCIDEAHNNVHTASGQFATFARLAAADGYRVVPLRDGVQQETLRNCEIVAIVSPRHARTLVVRKRPISEALSDVEIATLAKWVRAGGSLLLVADHMPIPGSMMQLGRAFGLDMIDGFATDSADSTARSPITLRRSDGVYGEHPVLRGRNAREFIDSIMIFTGGAFQTTPRSRVIVRLPKRTKILMPDEPWVFRADMAERPGVGLGQVAAYAFGRGRVAAFAEAAMFTAQLTGTAKLPMGMNHPGAEQNPQFVLNVLHWLARRL